MKAQKLKLNKSDFLFFLDSLSKLSDSAILTIKDGGISALSTNIDASLFLWNSMPVECDDDISTLNIPSLSKLKSALDLCESSEFIELTLNRNNLEYRGSSVKFKYHLHEDGVLMKSKTSLEKLKSLKYDISTVFSRSFLKSFLKAATSFSKITKLHLYTDDDHLMWSLKDSTIANSDVFTMKGNEVDFELDSLILNIDNIRLMQFPTDNINLKINTSLGIAKIELKYGSVDLNYTISSLIK
jgi:hypothetical protein